REVCFKHAYWTRQAELATFFEPKSPLYAKESDKAAAIQKVLAEAPLYESTQSDSMCHEVFTALKEMRGIRFVDPVVQTMSYEDPALDPWKQRARRTLFAKRCVPNVPLSFDYMCEARFSGDDADNDLLECEAWYGLPPFKIFELPSLKPQEKTRYIFYEDSGYGPMNREGVPWYPVTSGGNFGEFFTENCNNSDSKKGVYVFRMPRSSDKDDGFPNFNSVIIYRERYFILALERVTSSFWLTLRPIDVNATCRWSPVKPGPPVNK
ncbi:MAG: hypothetical protein FWG62_01780, partial [Proteobacteria bacterium]|nr:hypothetical protein [Pseudomonadota bacterium]